MKAIENTAFEDMVVTFFGIIANFVDIKQVGNIDYLKLRKEISKSLTEHTDTMCLVKDLSINKAALTVSYKVQYITANDNIKFFNGFATKTVDDPDVYSMLLSAALNTGTAITTGDINGLSGALIEDEEIEKPEISYIDPGRISDYDTMMEAAELSASELKQHFGMEISDTKVLPTIFINMLNALCITLLVKGPFVGTKVAMVYDGAGEISFHTDPTNKDVKIDLT